MSAAEACTAIWETGSESLTVTCPHGRTWRYTVVPVGDKPLPHLMWDLPWMVVPGASWERDDTDGAVDVWRVTVVPESSEIAGKLFVPHKLDLPAGS